MTSSWRLTKAKPARYNMGATEEARHRLNRAAAAKANLLRRIATNLTKEPK